MPTVAELKAELEAKGIEFKKDAKKAELEALLASAAEPTAEAAEKPTEMTVTAGLLNIRTEPDDAKKPETVESIAKRGDIVVVETIQDGWAHLVDGLYCRAEFLE